VADALVGVGVEEIAHVASFASPRIEAPTVLPASSSNAGSTSLQVMMVTASPCSERARGGVRTHTPLAGLGGLSPLRLPVPPPGRCRHGSPQATRAGSGTARNGARPAPLRPDAAARGGRVGSARPASPSTADQSRVRTLAASDPTRRLAATTPSIMSASTATQGRPFSRIETTAAPSARRRNVRSTSTRRGGLRKPGTSSPSRRATRPSVRAAAANRRDVASMSTSVSTPCDSRSPTERGARVPGRPTESPRLSVGLRTIER
jgi:hypothetical protein